MTSSHQPPYPPPYPPPNPPAHQPTRRQVLVAMGALATAPRVHAQADFSQVQIRTEKLTDTVYMLTGAGGNIGLSVGPDAVFLIDDQYAPLVPRIQAAVAAITPRPVQFVLNTHYHFDHTGGNEAFGQAGALIVAHHNVRRRMSSDQLLDFVGATRTQRASPKAALPVVTVAGEITFHLNGDEVHAFHVPRAHTDGDLIVHFRHNDVLHMGDVFFNGSYPFIDGSSGGSPDGLVAAFDRVLALAGERTRIIPGHGPLASRADLAEHRHMVATIVQRVKALRAEGQRDAEIRAARPSEPFDARFGGGFIKPDAFVQSVLGLVGR